MTREEAKKLLPIIQAFAEGKEIEYRSKGFDEEWRKLIQIPGLSYDSFEYRVKPETKYRPFKDADECWQEMFKHEPFGWVKTIANIPELHNISAIFPSAEFPVLLGIDIEENEAREYALKLSEMYDLFTFTDGTPFGVKEGVWEN